MKKYIGILILAVPAFVACYPIFFLLTGSLMGATELRENLEPVLQGGSGYIRWRMIPAYPTLRYYVELLLDTPAVFVMFWNSIKMTAGILIGQLLVGVSAAWGFAKFRFPAKGFLFTLYVILMMIPFQVRMLSEYLVLDSVQMLNSQWGIIMPAVFSTFPVFIMYRFFEGIPDAMIEAAKIDGANHIQVFVYIGLPLGSSGIISAMVLGFLEYWNLIEQPLTFLKNQTLWPLSLFLPNIDLEQAGMAFVTSIVTLLPAVFVFLAGQEHLEQGIVASGLKG